MAHPDLEETKRLAGPGTGTDPRFMHFMFLLLGEMTRPLLEDGPDAFHQHLFDNVRITADDIIKDPTFRHNYPNFQTPEGVTDLDLKADLTFETAQEIFEDNKAMDAAARTVMNIAIEQTVEDMAERGVEYGFGVKDGTRSIDCSGLVAKAIQNGAGLAKQGITLEGADGAATIRFHDRLAGLVANHSDGQVSALARKGGMLTGADVTAENIKAGMVVGLDTGDKVWDRGRELGVDHVGIVYRDSESGDLMFAQSSSSGGGVNIQRLDDWLDSNTAERAKLFAVDSVVLAETVFEEKPEHEREAGLSETFEHRADAGTTKPAETPAHEAAAQELPAGDEMRLASDFTGLARGDAAETPTPTESVPPPSPARVAIADLNPVGGA